MSGFFTREYEHWRATEVPNEFGEVIRTWAKIGEVQGRAYPTRMIDEVVARHRQGVVTWTFAAYPSSGVHEGDEIRFEGRRLKVRAVSVTSSGRRLEALCEELRNESA